jgi:hypothetical protein
MVAVVRPILDGSDPADTAALALRDEKRAVGLPVERVSSLIERILHRHT